jgi:hypothetical protein
MAWAAYTVTGNLQRGVSFHIVVPSQACSQSPDTLTAGVALSVYRPSQSPMGVARVLTASPSEVVFEMPDGSQWRMTPRTPADEPVSFISPALNAEDWVIRDQLRPPLAPIPRQSYTGPDTC